MFEAIKTKFSAALTVVVAKLHRFGHVSVSFSVGPATAVVGFDTASDFKPSVAAGANQTTAYARAHALFFLADVAYDRVYDHTKV